MARLTEDLAKRLVSQTGVPTPLGHTVTTAAAAAGAARWIGNPVVVKALVPSGRRDHAGGVRFAATPAEAEQAAAGLLGSRLLNHTVERVYVEQHIQSGDELFMSIAFDPTTRGPVVLATCSGGVDVEVAIQHRPELLITRPVDYADGLLVHHAVEMWEAAGLRGTALAQLARTSVRLYRAFVACDAVLLEANPILLPVTGNPIVVGVMLDVDDSALARQPAIDPDVVAREYTERERTVWQANLHSDESGSVRYIELPDGNLGLCIAGGGAGLYQFDALLRAGAHPANYSDISPGDLGNKLPALLTAALTNPGVRGLLFSINIMQLGRVDVYTRALVDVLERERIDTRHFPIVVRLAGLREAEGAAIVADVPGLHFHTDDVTLDEAVAEIVARMRA